MEPCFQDSLEQGVINDYASFWEKNQSAKFSALSRCSYLERKEIKLTLRKMIFDGCDKKSRSRIFKGTITLEDLKIFILIS
jgi:hypothetical protein